MRLLEEGFQKLGTAALERCARGEGSWVSIDEIGYLECGCPEYCGAIRELMEKKQVAAVVRKQDLPFLEELCSRPDVFCVDLDQPFGRIGCVIMASGLGRRFGGGKLLAKLEGKPLIEWTLDATEGIFRQRIVVTRHREVETLCREREAPRCFTACLTAAIRSGWDWRRWKRKWSLWRPAYSARPTSRFFGVRPSPLWPCAPPGRKKARSSPGSGVPLLGKGRLSGVVPTPVF